ncbi:porin [Thiomicrospira microaerophila]|uniref:porin n=1 Tax=Thiomicrospira microaerophila TaxID=406020 RepID=UPI00200BC98C|nr:porin [Thiomicrospira microaerophila]UQB43124.1 porin [Thiomicrospira microaerophila]
MKKNVLALAVGAALTAAYVPAMAEIKVSGRAHMSLDHMDNGADSKMDLSSNSSRIRFAGSKNITEGLQGFVQLEQQIDFDRRAEDNSGTRGNTFVTRDTFFGLKGDFGTVRLGFFDTPTKKVRSFTDMFGDRVGDARNMTKGTFDQRFHNSIHYQTPAMSGLTFDIQYSTDNRAKSGDQVATTGERDSVSTSLTFKSGDLTAMLAYEAQGRGDNAKDWTAVRMGATYNVAKGFRVAAFIEDADKNSNDNTVFGLGTYYDLTPEYRLRAQYYVAGESSAKNDGASMAAVGIDRRFGRDLTLYAMYAATSNDSGASFRVTGGGHGSSMAPSEAGKNVSAFSLGAIYNF